MLLMLKKVNLLCMFTDIWVCEFICKCLAIICTVVSVIQFVRVYLFV